MESSSKNKAYWRKNLQYLGILLGIWFITSYLCSVVFVEQLDKIRIGGCPLGFYFAQQASIWIFVELIFVYAWLMNRLERKYSQREAEEDTD
jgi:putative solute:sodium symporter small subunit